MLRLPEGMRDRIKAAADASGRSMNAEVVATLWEKYPVPTVEIEPNPQALIQYAVDNVPEDKLPQFFDAVLRQKGVTLKDIEQGLVPGVTLSER
jgi:plasmid stability protein